MLFYSADLVKILCIFYLRRIKCHFQNVCGEMYQNQQRSNQSNETNNTNDYNRFCLYKMVVNFEIVVQISKIKISTKGAPFLNIFPSIIYKICFCIYEILC